MVSVSATRLYAGVATSECRFSVHSLPAQVSRCMLGAGFQSGLNAMELGRAVWCQ